MFRRAWGVREGGREGGVIMFPPFRMMKCLKSRCRCPAFDLLYLNGKVSVHMDFLLGTREGMAS